MSYQRKDYQEDLVTLYDGMYRERRSTNPAAFGLDYWREHFATKTACALPEIQGHVLDLGCGTGEIDIWLSRAKANLRISAVDVSPEALRVAREHLLAEPKSVQERVSFHQSLIETLPFADSTFDACFMSHVMEHLSDHTILFRELYRVLRPGAPVIIVVPFDRCHDDPTHVWHFKLPDLEERLNLFGQNVAVWLSPDGQQLAARMHLCPKPRIICMMRVKNEERWIASTLAAAAHLVDGFVILDDNSTDRTLDICRSHPKVLRCELQNDGGIDEARDKDRLLQWALDENPDWLLALDGDEVLEDVAPIVVRKEIAACPADTSIIGFNFLYMWDSQHRYRVDGLYKNLRHPRLFRINGLSVNPRSLRFKRTDHGGNFHCGSIPANLPGVTRYVDVNVKHFGYFDKSLRQEKRAFYEARDPDHAAQGYYDHLTNEQGMVLFPWRERDVSEVLYSSGSPESQIQRLRQHDNPLWQSGALYLPGLRSHLDIGSNTGMTLRGLDPSRITCIEQYGPAARVLADLFPRVIEADARLAVKELVRQNELFDCVTMIDFIEHLPRDDGERLLDLVEQLAKRQILLFVPMEDDRLIQSSRYSRFMQTIYDTIPQDQRDLQTHRAFWTPDDFRRRGYDVLVLKDFHTEGFDAFFAVKCVCTTDHDLLLHRLNRYLTAGQSKRGSTSSGRSGGSAFGAIGPKTNIVNPYLITHPERIFLGRDILVRDGARIEAVVEYAGRTYDPTIVIGDGCRIEGGVHIGAANKVWIGKNVMIASRVSILDHDHGYEDPNVAPMEQALTVGEVVIEDDCWLGENVVVCKNVHIGRHAVAGANAVVTRDIPAYSVAVGNPARVIKRLDHATGTWRRVSDDWVEHQRSEQAIHVQGDSLVVTELPGRRVSPVVSIVIPVFNKVELTRRCLETLIENTPEDLYEVVIVDNASTDGTQAFLSQLSGDVKVIVNPNNRGFTESCNQGAQAASGKYLLFLNNDTQPQNGWLESMLDLAERDSSIGAVGAKLVYPDGTLQEAGGIIFSDGSGWNYGRGMNPLDPSFNFVREVDYCSGAALLVRSDLWKAIGGFDLRYAPAYYEDTDLCFAVREAGYRVVYQPAAVVVHHEGATAGTDLGSGAKRFQEVNRAKFVEKWSEALARQYPPGGSVRRASNRAPGKRILIIDPFMPMYDRASGSRRLFEMLKILSAQGHALTFIARNGANQERYAAELPQMGIEIYSTDPDKMRQLGCAVKAAPIDLPWLLQETRYDLAILSFWYVAEQYVADIRRYSPETRIVVDTVDVHFLREERQAELHQDREGRLRAAETKRHELAVYRQVDALIAVTDEDRRHLVAEIPGAIVHIVPNIHDVDREVPSWAERKGLLFVGNFRHPPNADAVLYFCLEVLPLIKAQIPEITFTIVGDAPPSHVQDLAGPGIVVTGYVPDIGPYLRSHRVSVAPVRFGAGMKGKIGEALACGLPVVTTTIGAEGMALPTNHQVLLVGDDPQAFSNAVVRAYTDEILWRTLSKEGRAFVESHYSPGIVADQLQNLLREVDRAREDQTAMAIERDQAHLCDRPAPTPAAHDGVGTPKVVPGLTSIIILTHNQWTHTEQCLDSINRHTPESHELVIVDNGSTDGTLERLRTYSATRDNVRLIVNSTNRGFAAGSNQGLAVARGEYVVLLNNDTIVTDGWLSRMRAVLERHPEVGLVGPMSNQVSGPQRVQDPAYGSLEELEAFAARWAEEHAEQSTRHVRVVGFCLLVRRAVIERVGGLDERFGTGNFEDDDYCIRAALAGFEVRIAHDSFVHHTGSQTFRGAGIDYRRNTLHNWRLFKAKWGIPAETSMEEGYSLPVHACDAARWYVPLPEMRTEDRPDEEPKRAGCSVEIVVASAVDQPQQLATCLEHVQRFGPKTDFKVTVLNKGQVVLRGGLDVTVAAELTPEEALRVALASDSPRVVLLSPDVIVARGWLDTMLAIAASDPTIAAVGPTSNAAPGPQRVQKKYRSLKRELERFAAQRRREHALNWSEVPYLGGFCLLLNTGAVRQVGGLGDGSPLVDLLWDLYRRLRDNGFKLACANGVYVHHDQLTQSEGADYKIRADVELALSGPRYPSEWRSPTR